LSGTPGSGPQRCPKAYTLAPGSAAARSTKDVDGDPVVDAAGADVDLVVRRVGAALGPPVDDPSVARQWHRDPLPAQSLTP
jgi:hypothetical protein